MAIVKIREIIGTSPNSFEDALNRIIEFVGKDKYNLTGIKILSQSVSLEKGKIVEYKITAHAAYKWEEEK
ncbi:MAG: dodecin family protein [Candidatus Paceibacterota bacterium]|jgi:flavin-binding protein dodecin|nr:dodecin family protein [Candidatus Paceibacterota bacterium]